MVNTLLENSRKTSEKDLSIQRYDVIPLSPNSGLIGWVPHCDTLNHLIREYRDARKVLWICTYLVFVFLFFFVCSYDPGWVGSCNLLVVTSASWFQITLNQEHKCMLGFAPDYDHLPLIAKVEVFECALQNTEGNDLSKVYIPLPNAYCLSYSFFFPLFFLEYATSRFLNAAFDRFYG